MARKLAEFEAGIDDDFRNVVEQMKTHGVGGEAVVVFDTTLEF